jgi:NADPH-dependent 2,4-dienoyl-CoA reductase/sulfur reductase-like enzyme
MQCVVNPELGNEFRRPLRIAARPRKVVVVVGAGPAGLEAARTASIRGHHVELFEAESDVGGQLRHSVQPRFHRREMTALVAWWRSEIARLGVTIRLDSPVTPEFARTLDADDVLIATGASWQVPDELIEMFGECLTSHEVLLDSSVVGESAVIVGGSEAGLNAALALSEAGRAVTLLEPGQIGAEISDLMRNEMLRQAEDAGVALLDRTRVLAAAREDRGFTLSLDGPNGRHGLSVREVVLSPLPHSAVHAWGAIPGPKFLGTVANPRGRLYQATQDGFWATAEI